MSDVAVIRLAAGKGNALTPEVLADLDRRVRDFEAGPARAAVIVGEGRFFSAGFALPALIELDRDGMRRFLVLFGDVMARVFACAKPVVAAVNGHAIAGGCVLALQCDYRVMADGDGKIGLSETQLGLGLVPGIVEPLRLAVPPSSLVPIAYAGRLFLSHEALELGLVDEVTADAEERATARAADLAKLPPLGLAQVKRVIRRPVLDAIRATTANETEAWLDTWFSADAQARVRARVEMLRA
jgi:enoyl-CoA hydratase